VQGNPERCVAAKSNTALSLLKVGLGINRSGRTRVGSTWLTANVIALVCESQLDPERQNVDPPRGSLDRFLVPFRVFRDPDCVFPPYGIKP